MSCQHLLTSTLSARIAPAELMLSGMCMIPRLSKVCFASLEANGLLVAPTQYLSPAGKFSATSSVIAKLLAQGTRKSQCVCGMISTRRKYRRGPT